MRLDKKKMVLTVGLLVVLSAVVALAGHTAAGAESPGEPHTMAPAGAAASKFDAADNAWMLVSSALVLFMTAPALALFYSGLVRRKNVLGVMMQCVALMCVMTIIWAVYGYSLVFGGNGPWIGGENYICMQGVDAVWTDRGPELPMVAGLACVTQAAGYITLLPAMAFGFIGATICYMACTRLKARFGYDDSLDVFGVHGVAGTLGAILTGIFATRATGATGDGRLLGLLEGGPLLHAQIVAALVAWGMAVVGTFVLLKLLDGLLVIRGRTGVRS